MTVVRSGLRQRRRHDNGTERVNTINGGKGSKSVKAVGIHLFNNHMCARLCQVLSMTKLTLNKQTDFAVAQLPHLQNRDNKRVLPFRTKFINAHKALRIVPGT